MKESKPMLSAGLAILAAALVFALVDFTSNLDIIAALVVVGAVARAFHVREHIHNFCAARDLDNDRNAG